MWGVRIAAMLSLALMSSAFAAESVFRCEGKDGRVTYSDAPCPSDSRAARRLDDAPPVSTSAKASPRDARDAGQIAQSRNSRDAVPDNRQLEEQIALARRQCAELAQRVEYARTDLELAPPNLRSTAELALRRAQDQYALSCPRR